MLKMYPNLVSSSRMQFDLSKRGFFQFLNDQLTSFGITTGFDYGHFFSMHRMAADRDFDGAT